MNNVLAISITKEFEPLLQFLYPTYAYYPGQDYPYLSSHFIAHRDITSRSELDSLGCSYHDCIFISTKIFDKVYDIQTLSEVVQQQSGERQRKFIKKGTQLNKDTFVTEAKNFLYGIPSLEDSSTAIHELFDAFGSTAFIEKFVSLSTTTPTGKLVGAVNTFVQKVLNPPPSSTYYLRKHQNFANKIQRNRIQALDTYISSCKDSGGLAEAQFFMNLVK